MIKIAIFASGSGSNAENLIKYFNGNKRIEVAYVVSNKKDAYVLERAKKLNIPSIFFSNKDFEDGNEVLKFLIKEKINFIVLAGFLKKIPSNILRLFPSNIVNIHPSLLPKFGGRGMYGDKVHQAVLDNNEKETGITIHYVNENYDEGQIIFQEKCLVEASDNVDAVAKKVHQLEYDYYPKIVGDILNNKCYF